MEEIENSSECVLVVGSTGAGKSTLISILTGQPVQTSNNANSTTKESETFQSCLVCPGMNFVDTRGFEDSEQESDDNIFLDMIRFLNDNNLARMKAVIWCVNPNSKCSATLQRQAKFISSFDPEIWKNVIIQVKMPRPGQSLTEQAQGSVTAGETNGGPGISRSVIGFTLKETIDESFCSLLTNEHCEKFLYWDHERVRQQFEEKLSSIGAPIQVVFSEKQCLDCGVRGDPRLVNQRCHYEMGWEHRSTEVEW